jgi:DNA segregation ATPase FtsK/SpoIIIE, S-DNA-T family
MPHCLVAGTTGSGKSVCINALVASMLFRFTPEQLRFIMIDPKVVEMQIYNDLPHLIVPVVTDPKKVLLALNWLIHEMEKRYKIFAKTNVRNITGFNARPIKRTQMELDFDAAEAAKKAAAEAKARSAEVELAELVAGDAPTEPADEIVENAAEPGERQFVKLNVAAEPPPPDSPPERVHPMESPFAGDLNRPAQVTPPSARNSRDDDPIIPERLPYIVVIVDELADLMQTAPADVENAIARITQMARAAGIHMIVATQTPRADVVTGIIKANIPSRIAFQVASKIDSRVILDENGAERLLGQGDMLYLPPGTSRLIRAQGVLVTDEEIHKVVRFAADQGKANFELAIHDKMQSEPDEDDDVTPEDEELVQKCIEIIRQEKKASTSMLQRRLRLGYTRAARVVDVLERRGIVGPENGAKGREILVDLDQDL